MNPCVTTFRPGTIHLWIRRCCFFIALILGALAATDSRGTVTNTFEGENGTLAGGVHISTSVAGYSGTGYLNNFTNSNCQVIWNFTLTPGLYKMLIRFRTPSGTKGFAGAINGHGFSGMFPSTSSFATFDAGIVEIIAGNNNLWIGGSWNYYEIDRVQLVTSPPPLPPSPVPATLVDTQATFATRMTMQQLVADYGKHTWAGQHDSSEINYIKGKTGTKPVIVEGDFIDYSPSRIQYGANPGSTTENYIALEKAGHVLSFVWHWNAPTNLPNTVGHEWWRGFYTDSTSFDVSAALANTNSVEYGMLLRDIDAIAVQLKKLSTNNIPVLWRPLHEASGGWFWWGAKGSGPFKQLWRLMFNRLTTYHNLHNLIWVLTNEDPNWYPGNDVVDIIGVDAYPSDTTDTLSVNWQALKNQFDGVKLLTLTEFGGVPDTERMHLFGVWWSWFCPWTGSYIEGAPTNTLMRIYASPEVITLDELNAIPPFITSITQSNNGAMLLAGTGTRGATNWILVSTNLSLPVASWSQVSTGKFSGGVFTFTDTQATNKPMQFYRVSKP